MDTLRVSMVGNQKFKQLLQESCSSRGGLVKYDNIPNSPSFHHVFRYLHSLQSQWESRLGSKEDQENIQRLHITQTVLNAVLYYLVFHFIQIQEQSWWAE